MLKSNSGRGTTPRGSSRPTESLPDPSTVDVIMVPQLAAFRTRDAKRGLAAHSVRRCRLRFPCIIDQGVWTSAPALAAYLQAHASVRDGTVVDDLWYVAQSTRSV